MKSNFFLIITILFLASLSANAQQAWTRTQGSFYTQIGGSYLGYNSLLDGNNARQPLWRSVKDITIPLFFTCGITDYLTISANAPLKIVTSSTTLNDSSYLPLDTLASGTIFGLGTTQINITLKILKKNGLAIAGHLYTDFRTTRTDSPTGLQTGYRAWGFSPSLALGYGYKSFFVSTEAGATIRTHGYSTQLFSKTQIGLSIQQKFYIIATLDLCFSLRNGSVIETDALHTGLYLDENQYQAPGLKLGYALTKRWSIWLGTGGLGIAGGRQLGGGPSVSCSVAYQLDKSQE